MCLPASCLTEYPLGGTTRNAVSRPAECVGADGKVLCAATVSGMRCPACENDDTKVVDSRGAEDGEVTRRRRECTDCKYRFTTFERVEEVPLFVLKRSGECQPFSSERIVHGLCSAAKGRPIAEEQFEQLASEVEEEMRSLGGAVSSERVGLAVLDRLRVIDPIAALRFASVYKGFTEVADFERELRLIKP